MFRNIYYLPEHMGNHVKNKKGEIYMTNYTCVHCGCVLTMDEVRLFRDEEYCEECIFDAPYRDMCLMDTGYYEEMEAKEHAYEYFNCPTRTHTGIGDRSKHTKSDAGNRRRSY